MILRMMAAFQLLVIGGWPRLSQRREWMSRSRNLSPKRGDKRFPVTIHFTTKAGRVSPLLRKNVNNSRRTTDLASAAGLASWAFGPRVTDHPGD